ncbi:hypothetical protein ANPL_00385 [Anaplasma platys]|uniref:Uncharacterized protein n=1 Tax=Anaplasma platys TaxID=949 RepID=A0A858PX92_9RICK|nr:hypothetical protein ANPL_00385 [Anaplasma platys]
MSNGKTRSQMQKYLRSSRTWKNASLPGNKISYLFHRFVAISSVTVPAAPSQKLPHGAKKRKYLNPS